MDITAAVVREKFGAFAIDKLELTDPRPDEALVRIVASGMCQTDLHGRDGYYNTPYPAVYGHEGAGVVQAVGKSVTKFMPGDHVVISFPWCGACPNCRRNMQSHCMKGLDLKMRGTRADGSTLMRKDGAPVYSAFFQQSSFATHAIANERYMVKVRKDAPLELLGPFACSGQTGAGAVLNSMQPAQGRAAGAVPACSTRSTASTEASRRHPPCVPSSSRSATRRCGSSPRAAVGSSPGSWPESPA